MKDKIQKISDEMQDGEKTQRFDSADFTERMELDGRLSTNNEQTVRDISLTVDQTIRNVTSTPSVGLSSVGFLTDTIGLNGNEYKIIRLIAKSGEAEIYLIEDSQRQPVVLKYYFNDFKPKPEIVDFLKSVKRKDLMHIKDSGFFENRFFEINEFITGDTLDKKIPWTDEEKLRTIIGQINETLNYCHKNRLIHRDIKPQNIFFRDKQEKEIVLGDFGISSQLEDGLDSRITTRARTSLYAAPELFTEIKGKTMLGIEVDYYALGVTILELWNGKNPFGSDLDHNMMRAKTAAKFLIPDNAPTDYIRLVQGLLTPNYEDRWGYEQVKAWVNKDPNIPIKFKALFDFKPFPLNKFLGSTKESYVQTPEEMANFIEKNQEIGIDLLYSRKISIWLSGAGDTERANSISDIVEVDYPQDKNAGLTEAIFILNAEKQFVGHDKKTKLPTFDDIAFYFEKNFHYYSEALNFFTNDFYAYLLALGRTINDDSEEDRAFNYLTKAKDYFKLFSDKTITKKRALNTVILDLNGGNLFLTKNKLEIKSTKELVHAQNINIADFLIEELKEQDSKLSIWLTINNPELTKNIIVWRSQTNHTFESIGQALGVFGLKLPQKEVFSSEELKAQISLNPKEFYNLSHDLIHKTEAWLKNYNDTSLFDVTVNLLNSKRIQNDSVPIALDYIVQNKELSEEKILENVEIILNKISNNFNSFKSETKQSITNILKEFYLNTIESTQKPINSVSHLDHHILIGNHYTNWPSELAEVRNEVLDYVEKKTKSSILNDLSNLTKNINNYNGHFDAASDFILNDIGSIHPYCQIVKDWGQMKVLLDQRVASEIIPKIESEKAQKNREVEKQFIVPFKEAKKNTVNEVFEQIANQSIKNNNSYESTETVFLRKKGVIGLLFSLPLFLYVNIILAAICLAIIVWGYFKPISRTNILMKSFGKWLYMPIVNAKAAEKIDNKIDSPYRKVELALESNKRKIERAFEDETQIRIFELKKSIFC